MLSGIFAGTKRIPAYTYLGVYAGEYITDAEGEKRGEWVLVKYLGLDNILMAMTSTNQSCPFVCLTPYQATHPHVYLQQTLFQFRILCIPQKYNLVDQRDETGANDFAVIAD